jgi:hypothetical protein
MIQPWCSRQRSLSCGYRRSALDRPSSLSDSVRHSVGEAVGTLRWLPSEGVHQTTEEEESMKIVAMILGILGGLAAILLGAVGFTSRGDASGAAYTMYTIDLALIPLGLLAIVGGILGLRRRSVSLGLLVASGLLMLVQGVAFLVVIWRDSELIISPANYGMLAPGVLALLAAMFVFLARPKAGAESSGS